MTLLGYHIDGLELAGNTAIREQVKRTRANWNLVMDDMGFAADIRPHCQKGLVYRSFDPFGDVGSKGDFDNDFWTRHSPAKTAQWMKTYQADIHSEGDNVYLTAGNNEPSSNPGNRRALADWFTGLMHELARYNIRGAIGEIAVAKTLEVDEIKAGVWDGFIDTLYEYRDLHILTIHEYSTGVLPANFIPGYPQNLLDKSIADKSRWIKQIPLTGYGGNYHLGRWLWLRERALERGKPIKRVVTTEGLFDYMEDNNANGKWLKETLRPMFQYGGFEGLKGWKGHMPYWSWLLGTNDPHVIQQFMFDMSAWYPKAMPPELEGVCQYGLNYDWWEWEGVDLSRNEIAHYRHLVETQPVTRSQTQPPVEPPKETPTMKLATLSGIGKNADGAYIDTRIRASRNVGTTPVIGYVPPKPESITAYVAERDAQQVNGYFWREIQFQKNGATVTGYVADDYVETIEVTGTFYDFNLGRDTIRMTESERTDFMMALRADANRHVSVASFYMAIADFIETDEAA